MSDAHVNNLPLGSADRSNLEMGMILTDMPVLTRRDVPTGGPTVDKSLVQPPGTGGMFGIRSHEVLARDVPVGSRDVCFDAQAEGRCDTDPVWNITNSRSRDDEFAVAGISMTTHTGIEIPGQNNWMSVMVAGMTSIRVPVAVSQGQVLVAMQPPAGTQGPEVGAKPLLIQPATVLNTPGAYAHTTDAQFETDLEDLQSMVEDDTNWGNGSAWNHLLDSLDVLDADENVVVGQTLWDGANGAVRPGLLDLLDPSAGGGGGGALTRPVTQTELLDELQVFISEIEQSMADLGRHDVMNILTLLPFAWEEALDTDHGGHLQLRTAGGHADAPVAVVRRFQQILAFVLRRGMMVIADRAARNCYSHVVGTVLKDTQAKRPCPILRA